MPPGLPCPAGLSPAGTADPSATHAAPVQRTAYTSLLKDWSSISVL